MSPKSKRSHSDIPIYQRLGFKLIIFFLIPALCIVALGIVSYQKASNAIIASYETSAAQTLPAMRSVWSVDSIRAKE